MKKLILTFSLIAAIYSCVTAQRSESEIALREYFIDAEFFLTQEFYLDALSDYLQVYKRGYQDNANINYRIGICYLNIPGQKDKSIQYFEKAKESVSTKYKESSLNEKNAPIDVYLYMGNAFRVNNKLSEAISSYQKYEELLPEDEVNLHKYAEQQIEACNIANDFMSAPVKLDFINMGEAINSSNDDYKAVLSGDGNTLIYMHRLPFYDAVYSSKRVNGEWTKPENITPQLLSDGDQYVTDISYDGKTLLLTKEDEFNSDIYVSRYADNRWSVSQPLGSNINTKYWESHACFSKDGKLLYFASNRNGGVGEMDLYMSELTAEGVFGPAKNISELNTELNEDTPFITEDGKSLFFSSQGFVNMGGYDIFVSELGSDNKWSVPENMGYPISTTDDDLFYFPVNNNRSALYARIDESGYGGMDIYKVEFPALVETPITKAIPEENKQAEETHEVAAEKTETTLKQEFEKTETGTLKVHIDSSKTESPGRVTEAAKKEIKTIKVQPLFFGFDKSTLTEESKKELDQVLKLCKSYPLIKLELVGYADPLGPESYNQKLSERRALAVLNYLSGQGIETNRLKSSGKGETEFIAINTNPDGTDNPEGRKYNRRVEFLFIGIDENTLIIKRINPVPPNLQVQ